MEEAVKEIVISTKTNEEKMIIGSDIHNQLRGNQDYIDNNIILNADDDCTIRISVFREAKTPTEINIKLV